MIVQIIDYEMTKLNSKNYKLSYKMNATLNKDIQSGVFICSGYRSEESYLENETNAIDIAYQIYEVARDLDFPDNLEEWCTISEFIDDFKYEDNYSKLSEGALITTIVNKAKKQLRRNSK